MVAPITIAILIYIPVTSSFSHICLQLSPSSKTVNVKLQQGMYNNKGDLGS